MLVPRRKLYHITHGTNLRAIIDAGGLLADSVPLNRRGRVQRPQGVDRVLEVVPRFIRAPGRPLGAAGSPHTAQRRGSRAIAATTVVTKAAK